MFSAVFLRSTEQRVPFARRGDHSNQGLGVGRPPLAASEAHDILNGPELPCELIEEAIEHGTPQDDGHVVPADRAGVKAVPPFADAFGTKLMAAVDDGRCVNEAAADGTEEFGIDQGADRIRRTTARASFLEKGPRLHHCFQTVDARASFDRSQHHCPMSR